MIQLEVYDTRSGVPALAAGARWASSWLNNGQSLQEILGCVSAYSDQAGQFEFYFTDDPTNPALTVPSFTPTAVQPLMAAVQKIPILSLFWQIVYTNGPVAQTQFEIVVSSSASEMAAVLSELQKHSFMLQRLADPYNPKDDTFDVKYGSL